MTKTQFIVLESSDDNIFFLGITDNWEEGVGILMKNVWELQENYSEDTDLREISAPYALEEYDGTPSFGITVTYKAKSWEKPMKEHYYLIEVELTADELKKLTR